MLTDKERKQAREEDDALADKIANMLKSMPDPAQIEASRRQAEGLCLAQMNQLRHDIEAAQASGRWSVTGAALQALGIKGDEIKQGEARQSIRNNPNLTAHQRRALGDSEAAAKIRVIRPTESALASAPGSEPAPKRSLGRPKGSKTKKLPYGAQSRRTEPG
jgi:hypothetical protein